MNINFEHHDLAVLETCDVVVYGGSFGGIAAALELARSGKRVMLVEPRTYLGREMTATLRPWLYEADLSGAPEFVHSVVRDAGKLMASGEIAFNLDALKIHLEDILIAAGVKLLYASALTGLLVRDGALQGVVIGNKSGRQVIQCGLLIDASETALAARLAGETFAAMPEMAAYFRTLEYDNVDSGLLVDTRLEFGGVRAVLHAGYRDKRHVLLACELTLPADSGDGFAISSREAVARQQTMAFAAALAEQVPAFQSAYLSAASYELCGPHTSPIVREAAPAWIEGVKQAETPLGGAARVSAFAGNVYGLWYLNDAVPLGTQVPNSFADPVFASRAGEALGRWLGLYWKQASARIPEASSGTTPDTAISNSGVLVREPYSPQRGCPYPRAAVPAVPLLVLRDVDVLVVGGGSSGAAAGIVAAKEGARTVLLEMNPGLGGTGTFGGVHSYWFGRRIGFSGQIMRLVEQAHEDLHHPAPKGLIPKWNIEAKSYALLKEARSHGAEILFNCFVIGTLVEGDTVRGVVVATRTGPAIICAKVAIDASGDGDVAAFGGADYVYGDERDHVVMWYALAQFTRPGLTRNHFTSMVDVSNIEDYTRAILAGRRRGAKGEMHDHGIYVAPRESRHIKGRVVLTLNDQLRQRKWEDAINIAFSNHDVKGHTGSDWLRVGLIPPNLEIEVPYRAILPEKLENILVVGKAISATHDALPAIRMQADLENLGGAAAMAAAQAVRENCAPSAIDIRHLQARLTKEAVLPPEIMTRDLQPVEYSDGELRALIDSMPADKPLIAYSDMELTDLFDGTIPLVEICCVGPRAIPLLEAALEQSDGQRKVLLAQALALVGSAAGVPVLIDAVTPYLQGDCLPPRVAHIRYTQLPPDHGAMPEAAYLLYSLSMVPDARALPVWRRVIDLLAATKPEDFYEEMQGVFYYVDVVCAAAERLASAQMIPPLKKLHNYPLFHGLMSYGGFQPDFIQERLSYLEVVIGRALARCGSADGFIVLISYLSDNRALLAEHAHSELTAITGADFGKNARAWSAWLEAHADDLPRKPWAKPTEPMQMWGETILRG
jgi:flavin-dependent dehydrogenase